MKLLVGVVAIAAALIGARYLDSIDQTSVVAAGVATEAPASTSPTPRETFSFDPSAEPAAPAPEPAPASTPEPAPVSTPGVPFDLDIQLASLDVVWSGMSEQDQATVCEAATSNLLAVAAQMSSSANGTVETEVIAGFLQDNC